MAKCGNCGKDGATVAEIRECFGTGPAAETTPARTKPTITEGIWKLPDGTIFKVQTSRGYGGGKAGNLYGKRLVMLDEPVTKTKRGKTYTVSAEWAYEPGVTRKLCEGCAVQLDDAEAARYGALSGICMFCGLDLTDERSTTAGYGPDCAENRGLPWGETAGVAL